MIGRVLKAVRRWLTGGGIGGLVDAYAARKDSVLERDRLEAEIIKAQIEAEIDGRRNAAEIRRGTAGFWEMRLISFLIAAPFALHAGAVGLDTTFRIGWGVPAYPPPFDEWEGMILLSFFGVYGLARSAASISAAVLSRRRS